MNNPVSKKKDLPPGFSDAAAANLVRYLVSLPAAVMKKAEEVTAQLAEPDSLIDQAKTSKQDYHKFAWWYIYKRLYYVLLMLLVLAIAVLAYLLPNYFFREEKLYLDSSQLKAFTGQAKVYLKHALKDQLVYQGMVEEGIYNGNGKLYKNTRLLYEGGFKDGVYAGEGQLYANGKLFYRGNFDNSTMNGQGTQFYPNRNPRYIGEFRNGRFSGAGQYFDSNGCLQYKGEFYKGLKHGQGQLFLESGQLAYEGSFEKDGFSGFGTTFGSKGEVTFRGFFKDSLPVYEEFMGIPESRVKELLGDPSLIVLPQEAEAAKAGFDPTPPFSNYQLAISLASTNPVYKRFDYNEASFSLILETSAKEPQKYQVTRILVWGGQTSASFDLSQPSSKVFAEDQANSNSNAEYGLKNRSLYRNDYLYTLYFYPDNKAVFLEIESVAMK